MVLAFAPDIGMDVGWGSTGDLAIDGHTLGVRMTSDRAAPAPGDWRGLGLYTADDHTTVVGLTVEYAGSDGVGGLRTFGYWNAFRSYERSTFRANAGSGVVAEGHNSFRECPFADNAIHGLDGSDDQTFLDQPFDGNTVTGNGSYGVIVAGSEVGQLLSSSTYSGNGLDHVAVRLADVTFDVRWQKLDVPYALLHEVTFIQSGAEPASSSTTA